MKTTWIGLGNLGRAMALHLKEKNMDLTVWNRTIKTAHETGLPVAESPAHAARIGDVIWLNLYDSEAVHQVLHGEKGILAEDLSGKIIIDTTTNHFLQVLDFHRAVTEKGGVYLEAPVLGSVIPASKGSLTMLVSGPEDAFRSVKSQLDMIATTIFHMNEPGLASKMKLINNHVLGAFMTVIAEAIAVAEDAGLPRDKAVEILQAGAGNSGILNAKKEKLIRGEFSPHFSSRLIYKDLHYLEDLAYHLKRPIYTAALPRELYGTTMLMGEEYLDFSAVYNVFKRDNDNR